MRANKNIKEDTLGPIKDKTYLNRNDIINGIKSLARTQGMYGRLLENLQTLSEKNPEEYNRIMAELEDAKFKDIADFVMYIKETFLYKTGLKFDYENNDFIVKEEEEDEENDSTTETEKYLDRDDIIKGIKTLAQSQGFYGRVLNDLLKMKQNNPEEYNRIMTELENEKFKDIVDFVLYIES